MLILDYLTGEFLNSVWLANTTLPDTVYWDCDMCTLTAVWGSVCHTVTTVTTPWLTHWNEARVTGTTRISTLSYWTNTAPSVYEKVSVQDTGPVHLAVRNEGRIWIILLPNKAWV